MLGDLRHLVADHDGLALDETRHRIAKGFVSDPMRGVGRLRQVAALDLVLALRPGLDALQALRDRAIRFRAPATKRPP
jgi:hypothetical protein